MGDGGQGNVEDSPTALLLQTLRSFPLSARTWFGKAHSPNLRDTWSMMKKKRVEVRMRGMWGGRWVNAEVVVRGDICVGSRWGGAGPGGVWLEVVGEGWCSLSM